MKDDNNRDYGQETRNSSATQAYSKATKDNLQDSPKDGRDQNITPDSNTYNPANVDSAVEDSKHGASSVESGTNPDRYAAVDETRSKFDTEDAAEEKNNNHGAFGTSNP